MKQHEESTGETLNLPTKGSCRDVYKDFKASSINSHKAYFRRSKESYEEEHGCFKATYEEDENKVTTLSYRKIFKLSLKLSKENDKLERNILDYKDHIDYLESNIKKINIGLDGLIKPSLKSSVKLVSL